MLAYIIAATLLDSLLGLVGIFSLYMSEKELQSITFSLVSFAAGAMLAGALIHMFPEALEKLSFSPELFIAGFILFFLLERFLSWHHCHKTACEVHPVSYLTVVGDGIHNFVDGVVIAAAFLASRSLGIITTLLIIAHELPQELGNFAVLLHSGMSRERAIIWTFLSQATCVLGGIAGWLLISSSLVPFLLALAGGGFLYIAASDLVPEMHEEKEKGKVVRSFLFFLLGVIFIEGVKLIKP